MAKINILDSNTIDKIAAGEVVERPVSVVKELVENAIDAGATIITVEIKDGGLSLIRVTDNGCGIEADQIANAFYPHATSKISSAEDLNALSTLGFRGEALSSITAVSRVELTTKTKNELTGIHCSYDGGDCTAFEEVGAPTGTTFIIRDLFYNTLPRLKFLKSESTEGSYIADMMEHIALSMPSISFQFINNGKTRFSTSGHGDLKEVIYRLYGKEISDNLKAIDVTLFDTKLHIYGYLGLPIINRANRSCELFFVNHRYIKSSMFAKAVEEGYVQYLMQHKFPFCILNLDFDPTAIDVNVHPTKQEIRISNEKEVYDAIVDAVSSCLSKKEHIDPVILEDNTGIEAPKTITRLPESFETHRSTEVLINDENSDSEIQTVHEARAVLETTGNNSSVVSGDDDFFIDNTGLDSIVEEISNAETIAEQPVYRDFEQLSIIEDERLLSTSARKQFRIIGQLFKTYWLIEYDNQLMIMDQHAAHEKVWFERLMTAYNSRKEIPSQQVSPAQIISLSNRDMDIIENNMDRFLELGFSLDRFGDREIAVRAIPLDLYGAKPEELIEEILNDLAELKKSDTTDTIRYRIATMACKAAVKGNNLLSLPEVEELLDEMLTLENPYNCPHGRPTLISFSKSELEKKFHRI